MSWRRCAVSSMATWPLVARRLASSFIRAGLVDEYRLVVHPVVIGQGTPFFPKLDRQLKLRQIDSKRFESGAMYLAYAAA